MAPSTKQPTPQLKDEAATHIRQLIISGEVPPGRLLRLAPLAERIGSSITPVREALLLLAQDGWVNQEPHRGFRVMTITRRDVEDAHLVLSFVSGQLAERAALVIDDEHIAALRLIDAEINAHTDDDTDFLESANYELHDTVHRVAESDRLTWFVHSASRFVLHSFWGMIPGWIEHNRTGHAPVIDALEARDPSAARLVMSSHVAIAGELLLRHLDSIDFWAVDQTG